MSKKEIYFVGLLANVDSSIFKMKFEHGFKVESMSVDEGIDYFSSLENVPIMETARKLSFDFRCLNSKENKIYFIRKLLEENIEVENIRKPFIISPEKMSFDSEFVHNYLYNVFRKMRLFKKGNICMPCYYYYYIKNNKPQRQSGHWTTLHISEELFTLNDSELFELYKFIKNTKLPFKEPNLQLAFENFELSYNVENINLLFLTLMMCLETLFHPNKQGELSYRISRNTAVLLGGRNDKDSETIYSEIRDLYTKRSKIVHTGKKKIIDKSDLLLLRYYVRESIKEIYKLGKNKDELLKFLNSCGYKSSLK